MQHISSASVPHIRIMKLRVTAFIIILLAFTSMASSRVLHEDSYSYSTYDTTPQDTTPQDTTPEDTTPQDTTPQDTTPQDTTPENATPEDTTPDQAPAEGTTPDAATPAEATPAEATPSTTDTEVPSGPGTYLPPCKSAREIRPLRCSRKLVLNPAHHAHACVHDYKIRHTSSPQLCTYMILFSGLAIMTISLASLACPS
jgi:hypothetical protein